MSVALLALALLTFAGDSASAATTRPLLNAYSTGPGSFPRAMASDDAGNTYVLEFGGAGGPGVAKFDSAGNPAPFSASGPNISGNKLTGAPGAPFVFEGTYMPGVAVDSSGGPTDGYIYVINSFAEPAVRVFDATGAYLGDLDPGHIVLCGLAVNPVTGEVYTSSYADEPARRFAAPVGQIANPEPNGRLNLPSNCSSLAVDSTGAAYLATSPNQGLTGVTRFDDSQFEAAAPSGTVFDTDGVTALAVDPADDSVYLNKRDRIVQRTASGAEVGSPFPQAPLNDSQGVAVGPGGAVSVAETNGGDGGVFVFGADEAALPLASTAAPSNVGKASAEVAGEVDPDGAGGVTACEFRFGLDAGYSDGSVPCTPAVSPGTPIASPTAVSATLTGLQPGTHYHARLFVTNAKGTTVGEDRSFDTPIAVEGVTTGDATGVTKDSASLNGSYVGDGTDTHYYFQYGTTATYGQTAPAPPGADAGSPSGPQTLAPIALSGLQGATEYHYRLVAANSFGAAFGDDRTFTTAPAVTDLLTGAAIEITDESAKLTGSFQADKYEVHYYFEYGPSTNYGRTVPVPPGDAVAPGAGSLDVPPVLLSDLQTGATYHFRIVASNATGKTFGQDEAFTTAERPSIDNLSTADVKATSAELKAVINPMKGETSYHFEYGPTTAYGTSVPVPDESIGSGSAGVSVSVALSELVKGVTYHFRVVAQNQYGTVSSGDQAFGFYPPPCPNAQLRGETGSNHLPDCRAYELVSPTYAAGTIIFPSGGPTTSYATDPPRLAYVGSYGAIPGSGDPINTNGDLYVATRTDTGWQTKYIGLPPEQTLEMGGPPQDHVESISQHGPTDEQIGVQSTPDLSRILSYDRSPPLSYEYPNPNRPPSNVPYLWSSTNDLLGRWPTDVQTVNEGLKFKGTPIASADFTHLVFSSDVVFAEGGEATTIPWQLAVDPMYAAPCCSASIYDNNTVTGEIEHISVKEDGKTGFLGDPIDVSDDGKVIVMGEGVEATIRKPAPLFVRVEGQTYDIAHGEKVVYVGSSADGRTLYVESDLQLTDDDQDAGNDLFVWRASSPKELTRVSAGTDGDSGNSDACSVTWTKGCGVLTIPFKKYSPDPVSEFFEYWNLFNGQGGNGVTDSAVAANGDIYFQSPEQLEGAKGERERTNLYRYADGKVEFVATLQSAAPTCSELYGVFCSQGPIARMQITPDGKFMAFLTSSRVTSYDNAGHIELYLYSSETKRLTCPSCVADGGCPNSTYTAVKTGAT